MYRFDRYKYIGLLGESSLYYYHKVLDATIPLLNVQFTTNAVNSYYIYVRPENTVVLYYYCFLRINYTHVHCSDLIIARRSLYGYVRNYFIVSVSTLKTGYTSSALVLYKLLTSRKTVDLFCLKTQFMRSRGRYDIYKRSYWTTVLCYLLMIHRYFWIQNNIIHVIIVHPKRAKRRNGQF